MDRRAYKTPPISQIQPGIYIGDVLNTYDEDTLRKHHISAVVSLVNAPMNLWKRPKFTKYVGPGRHLWVECLDSSTQDLLIHMNRICDFIDQMLQPTSPTQFCHQSLCDNTSISQQAAGHSNPKNPSTPQTLVKTNDIPLNSPHHRSEDNSDHRISFANPVQPLRQHYGNGTNCSVSSTRQNLENGDNIIQSPWCPRDNGNLMDHSCCCLCGYCNFNDENAIYQPQRNTENNISKEAPTQHMNAVLVHCERGVSRSPTAVVAYLMRRYRKTRDVVLAEVREKRRIKPSKNFMNQLEVWEQVGYQLWEDETRNIPKAPYKVFLETRAALLKKKGLTGNEPIRPLNLGENWNQV